MAKRISEKQKMINEFGDLMKANKVAKVEIRYYDGIIWQRDMNCADIIGKYYDAKGNLIKGLGFNSGEINEIFRKEVKKAFVDGDWFHGKNFLKLFEPLGIKVFIVSDTIEKGKPIEVEADSEFNVEVGDDC